MINTILAVQGITCEHCKKAVKNALEDIGITDVTIGQRFDESENYILRFDSDGKFDEQPTPSGSSDLRLIEISHELTEQAIIECIEELGYKIIPIER